MSFDHDVVIIGSGAAGGMAAYTLALQGVKCLILEAGPLIDLQRDRTEKSVYDLPYRGFGRPGRFPHVTQAAEWDEEIWLDEKENPYSYDATDPYYWVRMRCVGGKTVRWGRACWRLSDYEFAAKDRDGFGENWPIRYRDLAPYYDRVEPLFKVVGRNEGLPYLPDGKIQQNTALDATSVQRFNAAASKMGIRTTKSRISTGAYASSVNLLLPPALATGNLQIVTNAIAREIAVDPDTGLVNGVSFVDRLSKRDYHVPAKRLVLGASCLESTRLLLNSRPRQHPQGLGNSSGAVGRYLFDQFYIKGVAQAIIPEARGGKATAELVRGEGYVTRFRNLETKHQDFLRGYVYDFSSGGTPNAKYIPQYGAELLNTLADVSSAGFALTTMGEVLPRYEHHVRINPDLKDAWGIPSLHIFQRYTDNEKKMALDSMHVAEELCRAAGFEVLAKHAEMVPPGESIHDLGTCRMGANAKTSPLNGWCQSHDVKNLFVLDGSTFTSGGAQNPTLTILALAWRGADYLAAQMKKGAL